jgi:hypothetical protein
MAASVSDLTAPLDKKVVSADFYDLLGKLFGFPLALQPGEPIPAVIDVVIGWLVDQAWNPIVVPMLRAPFLDLATGDPLGNTAFGTYNRPRILSEASTLTITLENRTGGFVSTLAPGQVRVKNTRTGATYTSTTSISFDSSSPYPLGSGTFQADVEGSGGNANPGDIAAYPTPLVAGPVNVFAQTNASPAVGSDEEPDPLLVERCRLAPAELSSVSPPDAYRSVCLDPLGAFARRNVTPPSTWGTAAPAITRVGVVEPGSATINVYLASASGPAAGDTSTPDTDVYKAWQACLLVLPPGFTLTVAAATLHTVALGTITLYVDRGSRVTQAEATATATLAINAFFSTLAVGGTRIIAGGAGWVFADAIIAVLGAGKGVIDIGSTFADTALLASDVAVPTYTFQVQLVTQ